MNQFRTKHIVRLAAKVSKIEEAPETLLLLELVGSSETLLELLESFITSSTMFPKGASL
jgi:hypothetical protein